MNSSRFTQLLHLYLADEASADDQEELMKLIREGVNDDSIKDSINTMLLNDLIRKDMDVQKARMMASEILATGIKAGKIVPMRSAARATWRWVAAAAVLFLAMCFFWVSRTEPKRPKLVSLEQKKSESAVFTGKQFVHLPDGSTVLLNENSKLIYLPSFGEQTRKVTLVGEGYFEVRHDPSRPFIVLTGKVTTTVLGTAFNIKAYPEQQEIKVTVTRGKVEVGDDKHTFGIVTSDQEIAVNTITNDFVQTNLKAEVTETWTSQYLVLDDVSMEQAATIIAEKYNVEVTLATEDLKKCRITATFLDGENLDQVLKVVSGVVQASYEILPDGHVKIEGRGCKKNESNFKP